MQVHVYNIEPHIARTYLAENCIQVGAVVIQQAASLVNQRSDLFNAAFKYAKRGRVGQHDAGRLRANGLLQRFNVDITLCIGRDLSHLIAAHYGSCRIRAMRSIRHQYLGTFSVAIGIMVGTNHRYTGKLTLRTGHRRHGDGLHTGNIFQYLLQVIHTGQKALPHGFRRQRVACQETRQHGQRIAGARVVFHGAGAQWIELGIDGKILLRQARKVPYYL